MNRHFQADAGVFHQLHKSETGSGKFAKAVYTWGKGRAFSTKKAAEINKYHYIPLYMEKQSLPCCFSPGRTAV